MRRNIFTQKSALLLVSVIAWLLPFDVSAGISERYTNGIEGVKAASVPPPGNYYRMYNVFYEADTIKNVNGLAPDQDVDLSVFANVHRFIHVTNRKFLGADYFWDVIVPVVHTDIKIVSAQIDKESTAVGDMVIEPVGLAWHSGLWDTAFALTFFLPTADYAAQDPSKPGRDYATGMFSFGFTRYLNATKHHSFSLLARYEYHGEHDTLDIQPGDDFHFEWGMGYELNDHWEAGLAGYYQKQVEADSGSDVSWGNTRDEVIAVGPELIYKRMDIGWIVQSRLLFESDAEDRAEGMVGSIVLTKFL